VTHFIFITEAEGFQGQSWNVQCEILQQQNLLEVLPKDEEPIPPHDDDGHPPMFDFFGLGQPCPKPFNPPPVHFHDHVEEEDED
jgi:hypothetical protein